MGVGAGVGDELGFGAFVLVDFWALFLWFLPSTNGALFLPVFLPEGFAVEGALGDDDFDGRSTPEPGEALGEVPAVGGVVVPVVGETWATRRKRSCATWVTRLTRLFLVAPGTWTTISSLPWVFTVASETPEPFTRSSMMLAAVWRLPEERSLPLLAIRVIWVPPSRSRPRAGFQVPTRATRA